MNFLFSSQTMMNKVYRNRLAGFHYLEKQRGIGMAGFIIGIVVGLAVALAVAVYITKVPTPFTDKSAAKTTEQQAAEEERLKSWNPNAPLASKASAPSPGGLVQPTPDATSIVPSGQLQQPTTPEGSTAIVPGYAQPAKGTGNNLAIPSDRDQQLTRASEQAEARLKADMRAQELARAKAQAEEANASKSNDPIGALVQARNRQTPGTTEVPQSNTAGAEPFVYYVQAGAFRDQGSADSQRARLSMLGLNARINERQQSGRTVYQVRLGPFHNKAEADNVRSRIESNGIETALVRVQS